MTPNSAQALKKCLVGITVFPLLAVGPPSHPIRGDRHLEAKARLAHFQKGSEWSLCPGAQIAGWSVKGCADRESPLEFWCFFLSPLGVWSNLSSYWPLRAPRGCAQQLAWCNLEKDWPGPSCRNSKLRPGYPPPELSETPRTPPHPAQQRRNPANFFLHQGLLLHNHLQNCESGFPKLVLCKVCKCLN